MSLIAVSKALSLVTGQERASTTLGHLLVGWASCSGAVCGFRGDLGHLDTRVLKTAGPAKSLP